MGGVGVASGTDVDADLAALLWGEAVEDAVVQGYEVAEEISGWVEFEGQAGFGEVDLNVGGSGFERASDVGFGFAGGNASAANGYASTALGGYMATAGFDGTVRIYDVKAGNLAKAFIPVPLEKETTVSLK